MSSLSGYIMSGDKIIATIENSIITSFNEKLIPLYLKNTKNIEQWLKERSIDQTRINSRLLKKVLRISSYDDLKTVLSVNAATITDTYWFKEKDSVLTFNDVCFRENLFDNLALKGDPNGFSLKPSRTPELTNTGSFEKCWRLIDGKWWLYKQGNDLEYFSELFIFHLGSALGFPMADYELHDGYIRTKDFTDGGSVNFESIDGIVGSDDSYELNFNALISISEDLAKQYLQIVYLDVLCLNPDRHTKNYGLLRDVITGEILSMAPNFDNNLALISRGYVTDISRDKDGLINYFEEFINKNETARQLILNMNISLVNEDIIDSCIQNIPINVDSDYICQFILNGQERIRSILCEEQTFIQKI